MDDSRTSTPAEQFGKILAISIAVAATAFGVLFIGGGIVASQEILKRNPNAGAAGFLPLIFAVIGVFVVFGAWRGLFRTGVAIKQNSATATDTSDDEPSEAEEMTEERLQEASSAFGMPAWCYRPVRR